MCLRWCELKKRLLALTSRLIFVCVRSKARRGLAQEVWLIDSVLTFVALGARDTCI